MSEHITCILYGSDLDVAHILTEFAPPVEADGEADDKAA